MRTELSVTFDTDIPARSRIWVAERKDEGTLTARRVFDNMSDAWDWLYTDDDQRQQAGTQTGTRAG